MEENEIECNEESQKTINDLAAEQIMTKSREGRRVVIFLCAIILALANAIWYKYANAHRVNTTTVAKPRAK